MNVLLLIVASLGAGGVAVLVAGAAAGPAHVLPAVVALGLCLVPAVASLSLVERVRRFAPDLVAAAVLAGAGLRMAVVVAGVVLLGPGLARFGCTPDRFVGWAVGFYLLILAVESVLTTRVVGSAAGAAR